MKKAIAAPVLSLMFTLTCFSELNTSFEGSLDGWAAASTNITLSLVTEHATDGSYAIKAEHSITGGQVGLTKVGKSDATWWSAVTDVNNDTMSVDIYVPAEAIDITTWGKVLMRFFGSNFDIQTEAALTMQTNNSIKLTLDFSSVKEDVPSASWASLQVSINSGTGATRSPVYIDNYRVYNGSGETVYTGLIHSFEDGTEGWLPVASNGALQSLTVPDVPAEAVTYSTHALKATHDDAAGFAELMRITHSGSTEWWSALRNPDNKYMQLDVFVPGEAIDASWASVNLTLQGAGFSLTVQSNLVKQVDNQLTVVMDYSSISNSVLQAANWGQLTFAINGGDPSTRTPVYIDNYQIYAETPLLDPGSTNEPPPTVVPASMTIESAGASFMISTTNLSDHAAVTNIIQVKTNILQETWEDLASFTGVSATNWTIPFTNRAGFYRIISVY